MLHVKTHLTDVRNLKNVRPSSSFIASSFDVSLMHTINLMSYMFCCW